VVTSNAWISVSNLTLTITSNATIQAGGGIVADGMGYGANLGQGRGGMANPSGYSAVGGGGAYGGYGAAGSAPAGYSPYGGSPYGSVTGPTSLGSGGGMYVSSGVPLSSAGGGAIRMNVTGALVVNGRISANGWAGLTQGAGGGAGGSVWLTAGTLAGNGIISANGGTGNVVGGGGSGGRVHLQYGVNAFQGGVTAYGGGGYAWGGAGTIYTAANGQTTGQVLVDNGGHSGTNTLLFPFSPAFDLSVRGGAVASPSASYLVLSNLFVTSGGVFTVQAKQTNVTVAVWRSVTVDASSAISLDGKGSAAGTGLGAGQTTNSIGSGAGFGGVGGASSLLAGGGTYGSVQQPIDFGSGGGLGYGTASAGSEGGGAIRLSVGGMFTLNGRLSAAGNPGMQDDAGGGSGGSLWLTAGTLAGWGTVAADGGAGEWYSGGGGGGGRIAIYAPLNMFGGVVSAAGGAGFAPGQTGSVYFASSPAAPQVTAFAPTGTFTNAVGNADIYFDTPVNPYSVAPPNLLLAGPGGLLVTSMTAVALSPYHFQIGFTPQTAQGDYAFTIGPQVLDLQGQPMSQAYTGTFSITWMTVQGTIADTNGLPVPGVLLQPDGGAPATTTDINGNYALGVPPAGTVHVTPSKFGLMFVPGSRAYTNVSTAITNENYLAVSTVLPALATVVQSNSLILNWYGISGVTYQPLYSTNLVNWLPYDGILPGANGPLQLECPMGTNPIMFFRVRASY
jgi:hypothetical protein